VTHSVGTLRFRLTGFAQLAKVLRELRAMPAFAAPPALSAPDPSGTPTRPIEVVDLGVAEADGPRPREGGQ